MTYHWFSSLLISLDEDLSNSHTPTAFTQGLLHRFTSTHNRDSTDLALKLDTGIRSADWRRDSMRQDGQVIEGLFYQKSADTIAVKDEVGTLGILVSDHAIVIQLNAHVIEGIDGFT